ncbi:hypothetical protein J2X55_002386 [Microbacterium sp. 1154]|uniref:hypothetical protein n=1 Tax=Microbacterium sp. 1154 TaxID=2817733 RepID=UPI00285CADE7|nr:hypothetical protein [Microbacterium sp. 1154]MDR6691463.1 hypothetical protein [Microbacterium sp. 1154]
MAGKSATDLIIRLLVEDESLDKVDRSKAKFDAWNDALEQGSKLAAGTLLAVTGAAAGSTIAFANAEEGVDRLAGTLALTEPQAAAAGEAAANAYANAFGGSLEEVQAATAVFVGCVMHRPRKSRGSLRKCSPYRRGSSSRLIASRRWSGRCSRRGSRPRPRRVSIC